MSNDFKTSPNASKSENGLCRCCHSEGLHKSLYTSYFWLNVEEVMYADVLKDCFNIQLHEMKEPQRSVLCTICYNCIQRLEDAVKFKRQIQKCEIRFLEIYAGGASKGLTYEVPIKEEILDPEDTIIFESTGYDEVVKEDIETADDGEHPDFDGNSVGEACDDDFGPDDEENISLRVGKTIKLPRKRKKNKTAPAKQKKSKLPKRKEPGNEEVIDTIAGVIKVVKRLIVKRDVDYKKNDENFQCQKCPHTSKTIQAIRDHIRTIHLNIYKYKCPICAESYSTLATFTRHKLDEHNLDDRFKCNACDNAFNTKVQLKKHINTFHMLGVKIKCEECDYETFSVESLYKHKFKHKTVKDYQCKYCRKAFVRKTTMQLHERIHTGDRRKVCAVCGQAFVQKASLNYHMTKYHPEVAF